MKHHRVHYPISALMSKTYRSNNEGFVAYTPPALIIVYGLYITLPYQDFILSMIQIIIMVCMNEYIHTQIHTENSWLEKYKWFNNTRQLHFIHHKKLISNFTFGVDFSIDKLNGTYLKKII